MTKFKVGEENHRGTTPRLTLILLVALSLGVPQVSLAHSPILDACECDWCFFDEARSDDTARVVQCNLRTNTAAPPPACECSDPTTVMGSEVVWFDAEGDAEGDGDPGELLNDLATLATTADDTFLYFYAGLFNDPDPNDVPSGQLGIDVVPGGNTQWLDTNERLAVPGAGQNAGIEPDYLVVFDFSDFVFGGGIIVGDCTPTSACYGKLYRATPPSWTFVSDLTVALDPGTPGGTGGPPGKIETAVPWAAFTCDGCPTFLPGDPFRFTFISAEGLASPIPPFTPNGPIEDLVSEQVAGTHTTSPNSCTSGPGSTSCELADDSADGFLQVGTTGDAAGQVPDGSDAAEIPLRVTLEDNGDVTLEWDLSCLASDTDYEVYEGTLGDFTSHAPVMDLCSTGALTTATFTPADVDTYYWVVPANATNEGSYGIGQGTERPQGSPFCKPRSIGTCPP